MTHFDKVVTRLNAVEMFLWTMLIVFTILLVMGTEENPEPRMRVLADNNSYASQLEKVAVAKQMTDVHEMIFEDALYPPKRVGGVITPQGIYSSYDVRLEDGRGDNFWCILVKNSCYDEQDVEEPKSFFVMLWKRWFSTDSDTTHPQDGDKVTKQEG